MGGEEIIGFPSCRREIDPIGPLRGEKLAAPDDGNPGDSDGQAGVRVFDHLDRTMAVPRFHEGRAHVRAIWRSMCFEDGRNEKLRALCRTFADIPGPLPITEGQIGAFVILRNLDHLGQARKIILRVVCSGRSPG